MKILQDVLKKANVIQELKLFTKKDRGGTQTTGPHTVKLIDSKIIKGTEFQTGKEIYIVRLLVEESGEQKKYDFPLKDKKGDIHYLVQRLADFPEGSEVILEGKSQGGRSFTEVRSVNVAQSTENIPTINTDETTDDTDDTDDIPIINESVNESKTEKPVENAPVENIDDGEIDVSKLNF